MLMEILYQSSIRTPRRSQMLTGRSTPSVSIPLRPVDSPRMSPASFLFILFRVLYMLAPRTWEIYGMPLVCFICNNAPPADNG